MKQFSRYFLSVFYLTLMLFFTTSIKAQTDTEFWFAAPKVSETSIFLPFGTGFNIPILLRMSTMSSASTVTITQPANPAFGSRVITIPPNTAATEDLTANIASIQNFPPNNINNWGLKITATSPITVYYEVSSLTQPCNGCNPEMFSLKGRNALGTSFFTPFQNVLNNGPEYLPTPFSAFDIVATQNATTVTITPTQDIVGHLANIPFDVVLNEGQTYSAQAVSQLAANHLGGSKVTSDKPIAVTMKDDLADGGTFYGGSCDDLIGDQLIPVNRFGYNYAVVKGYLNTIAPEKAFIVASEDNTTINVAGSNLVTINAGQTYVADITQPATYITSTKPTILLHMSGFECETAGAILPPLDCNGEPSGSPQVSFVRSTNQPFFANILVRTTLVNNFLFNGAPSVITASNFAIVPNTNGAYSFARISLSLAQLPEGASGLIDNTAGVFQLGIIHGGENPVTLLNTGVRYAYFSDFKNCIPTPFTATVTTTGIKCFGDNNGTATFTVSGGVLPYTLVVSGPTPSNQILTTNPQTITGLKPGSYTYIVTDGIGATTNGNGFSIAVIGAALSGSVTQVKNIDCNTGENGSFKITPAGGTSPYVLTGTAIATAGINITSAGYLVNNLPEGTYNYVITDNNDCKFTFTVRILKNCNEQCFESPTKPTVVNGKSIWSFDIDGNVVIRTTLAKTFVDNTYGNQTIGWPSNNHSFKHLVTSDQLQLALYDAAGVRQLEFKMDYISLVGSTYKSLGVLGGDGAMLFGSSSNIISVTTSLEKNLQLFPGSQYTTNSPATNASYGVTTDPNAANWIYDVWFEVTVNPSAFPGGFGYPRFTGVHASPSKTGNDSETVIPVECPGELSIGDLVWNDINNNGFRDAGEAGIGGALVKLRKGGVVIKTTTTSSTGAYVFNALPEGSYVVSVTLPANFEKGAVSDNDPNNANDNDNNGVSVSGNEVYSNTVNLTANNLRVDFGLFYAYVAPPCTNTTQHTEKFPNQFNTGLSKSLVNKTFTGTSGTWTANSNAHATIAVLTPYYLPSTSHAIKIVNYKTPSNSVGTNSAVSPKINIGGTCCPAEQEMSFTLWSHVVTASDIKSALKIDFSKDGGATWTEVWAKTSAQINTITGGANKKTTISIPVAPTFQTSTFKYRFRGEMQMAGTNNFYLFIDDISIKSPTNCVSLRTTEPTSMEVMTVVPQEPVLEKSLPNELTVTVMPNPTRSQFTMEIQSKDLTPIRMRLMDNSGRLIRTFSNLPANHTLRFGNEMKKGAYFAEVIQGEQRKIIKLVKM